MGKGKRLEHFTKESQGLILVHMCKGIDTIRVLDRKTKATLCISDTKGFSTEN